MRRKKNIPQQVVKILKILLLSFMAGITIYIGLAMLFSFLPTHPPKQKCNARNTIFLSTNEIHLDIIIPVHFLNLQFLDELNALPGTQFVAFGWGDKDFYIHTPEWSDLTFSVAFQAVFLKSESAMHVTYYQRDYPSWYALQLCDRQMNSLINYIKNSFEKTDTGELKKLNVKGYTDYDFFFDAKGSFSFYNTCNTWANRALKTIQVKTSIWSPFDFGVLYHIKLRKELNQINTNNSS